MFQSNKEYLEFLKQSGVHSFLKETPNNYLKDQQNETNIALNKDKKRLDEITEINELIPLIINHKSSLQNTAKNLVLFDGNTKSKLMIIGDAPGIEEDEQGLPFVGSSGQLLNKMLSAIQSFSLKPDSLNASKLTLLPEYRWDRATDQQQFMGFRVTRTISFTITEIDRLGAALSALANAGATLISSPIMGSSSAQDAKDDALVKAVEDAHEKLKLLAKASDMSLARVIQISEVPLSLPRSQPTLMRRETAPHLDSSDTFVQGNLTFVAKVTVQAEAE